MNRPRRVVAAIMAIASGAALALTSAVPAGAQPAPAARAGFSPSSTSWTSPRNGWILGWSPCDAGTCSTLLHTSDGGMTWSEAVAPEIHPSQIGNQTRVFFAQRHGHSIGLITNSDVLYASYDGARSWQRLNLPGTEMIGGIGASARSVFVVGHTQFGTQVASQVFSSPINHPHWSRVRVATTSPGSLYSTMSVVAGSGRAVQIAIGTIGGVVKLATALNGHRFRTAYPCTPRSVMYPGMTADGRQFVLCSSDPGHSNMYKILRTGDADDHFTTVAGMPPVYGITSDFAVAGDSTIAVGVALKGAGLVYMSFDGGKTWQTTLAAPWTGPVRDLAFQDARHGILVAGYGVAGSSAVFRTTDGGHTWKELALSP